jgi:hydroxyacylglutathione hydrolase
MGLHFPQFESYKYKIHTLQTGFFKENCYVIVDRESAHAVIVDPGAEADYLKNQIDSLGVRIDLILLTHGHFDHLGAAESLAEHYGVSIHCHQIEKTLIRQAGIYAYIINKERLIPPANISYFDRCQDFNWRGGVINTIPCPGHTAGSVSYLFGSEIVFTGDTLFNNYIGPSNYHTSNYSDLITSVESLLVNLRVDCVIFPGHGKPWLVKEAAAWWRRLSGDPPQFHLFGDGKVGS